MDRILALTPVPSLVLDVSFTIVQASKSYLDISKFTLEECVGLGIYEFVEAKVPVPDVASMRLAIETALATKDVHIMDGIGAADHYWRVRTIPIFDEDKLLYVVLEAQDTTEEYTKRQALNQAGTCVSSTSPHQLPQVFSPCPSEKSSSRLMLVYHS